MNMINFTTVPPSSRILYVNLCGLVFNVYLRRATLALAVVQLPQWAIIRCQHRCHSSKSVFRVTTALY